MISHNLRNVVEEKLMKMWALVNLPLTDPRRENLPESCSREWFCSNFVGVNDINEDESIWSQISKLHMHSPLALLACVPVFRQNYFKCKTKMVNGTPHKVIGTSIDDTGIKDSTLLLDEYTALFRLGLKNSLKMI